MALFVGISSRRSHIVSNLARYGMGSDRLLDRRRSLGMSQCPGFPPPSEYVPHDMASNGVEKKETTCDWSNLTEMYTKIYTLLNVYIW